MPTMSQLDANQVIKLAADETNGALRVNVIATTGTASPTPILSGDASGHEATVNASGELLVHATLATESIEIGTVDQGTGGVSAWKVDGSGVTQPVSAASLPLPTGASTAANQTTNNTSVASIDTKTPALGQAAMAASSPVVIASNQSALAVTGTFFQATQPVSSTLDTSSTSTLTNVASSATSVSILASTAGRKGAYFFNDSTAILYLKFGTTASATSYTVQIQPNGFFEMPVKPIYTGAIDGIWGSANGTLRLTELS